jgi:hypothetical protein
VGDDDWSSTCHHEISGQGSKGYGAMGIAIAGIAGYETADDIRSIVPADGYLKYYIGTAGTWRGGAMDSQETESIRSNMKYIDGITGLAWKEVYSESEAQIFFYKAGPEYYDESDTIGLTEFGTPDNGITVTWLDEPGNPNNNGEAITIKHEIAHIAALEHPYGDGFNASYTRADTIMSYNRSVTGTAPFTDSDKLALKAIWGEDRKTFVPGRGTHSGTVFADKFYLQTYDGFGEGAADIVNGFSDANGDQFQFTTSAMGWDASKTGYRLLETSNSFKRQKIKKSNGKVKWRKVMGNDLNTVNKWDDANTAIYNTSTGELFADNNGSAYGLGTGGLLAVFTDKPALSYDSMSWLTG